MHRRISTTLNTLRQDLAAKLGCDFIHHACRQAGHSWCDSCLLTPAAIIHWFLIQVLHGNTALTHVSLLAGRAFTASAFCQARARLPLAVFQTVLRGWSRHWSPPPRRWVDGAAIAPSWSTARRSPCPTLLRCRPTSASPATRPRAAASRWPTSWRCSTPAPGCSWRFSRRRCGRMTWPASPGLSPCSRPAISCWLTAVSARLPIWPC